MLLGYLEVNGCVDDAHHICEQLAAHVPRESSERAALTSVRPVINDQHGFHGIRVGVWIAERSVGLQDRKSTRLNSSHMSISYAVFCLKKKKTSSASALRATSVRKRCS